jgi:hypothetical protein
MSGHRTLLTSRAAAAALTLLCLFACAPAPAFGKRDDKGRSCAMTLIKEIESTCYENAACANSYASSPQGAATAGGTASPAYRRPRPRRGACQPFPCGACITACHATIRLGGNCTQETCRENCVANPQYNCPITPSTSPPAAAAPGERTCMYRMLGRVNDVSLRCRKCVYNRLGRRLTQSSTPFVGACMNVCIANYQRNELGPSTYAWEFCSPQCVPSSPAFSLAYFEEYVP